MHFLFLFMDGIGLGADDENNPFAYFDLPNLHALLGGKRLLAKNAPLESERATLLSLDPNLGVEDLPQSATGQATLVTGKNVPKLIGKHYGPKPTPEIADIIRQGTIFSELKQRGYRACLLNAYPQGYFDAIESGKRLYSAIPLAVTSAGIALHTKTDLDAGQAFSVDFTGRGWRERLGYKDSPEDDPHTAGQRVAEVTRQYGLAFFEFWLSDYAGHHQDREGAAQLLENFDAVLGGLLKSWNDEEGLILITSDHGNMEDLSTRRHTDNPVPGLVIGAKQLRELFTANLRDLSDIAPAILQFFPDKN